MIGRPLREEAGLAAPLPPPERGEAGRPEPSPPELFGSDAEGALVEAGAGEMLEHRGPLASFAAEGMGGGAPSEARGGGATGGACRRVGRWCCNCVYLLTRRNTNGLCAA